MGKWIVSLAVALSALTCLGVPSMAVGAPDAPISGSGSAWAADALSQWQADVFSATGSRVDFAAVGSTVGRSDFARGHTDFAVSDLPYLGTDEGTGSPDTSLGRAFAYVPIVAGGVAVTFHVAVEGHLLTTLRLSGRTLAEIFTGRITDWADPAITADNGGRALPSLPVVPVVRSDAAGSTYAFTDYLAHGFPGLWGPCNDGDAVATPYFPVNCGSSTGAMIATPGPDGVLNRVTASSGNGTVAISEYTYPLMKNYPVASIANAAGYYVPPTGYNVAIGLTAAAQLPDGTQDLAQVYANPDARAYPLSSYGYAIVPTSSSDPLETTGRRQAVIDFLAHGMCQGQAEIGPLGLAPLPLNLVEAGFAGLGRVAAADPSVATSGLSLGTCRNPTFDSHDPSSGYLQRIAPMPAPCQRVGAVPCGAAVPVDPGQLPVSTCPVRIVETPVNLTAPRIDGRARVGAILGVRVGAWTGSPKLSYQWLADGRAVAGATSPFLTVPGSVAGKRLSVRVTATQPGYGSVRQTSARTTPVSSGRFVMSNVRVVGRPAVGEDVRLTASIETQRYALAWSDGLLGPCGSQVQAQASGDPAISVRVDAGTRLPSWLHVRWYADARLVRHAHGASLHVTRSLRGKHLRAELTAVKRGYVTTERASVATKRVRS